MSQHKVMYELTQPLADADGNVVAQPGSRYAEGAAELEGLPAAAFKPVVVAVDPDSDPYPEHNTAGQPQRVTQPGPVGDGDQIDDDKKDGKDTSLTGSRLRQPAGKAQGAGPSTSKA